MSIIDRLKERRAKLQQQLDRWVARGFRGGPNQNDDATQKETARKVSEVADLNRLIAERDKKDRPG